MKKSWKQPFSCDTESFVVLFTKVFNRSVYWIPRQFFKFPILRNNSFSKMIAEAVGGNKDNGAEKNNEYS